MGNTVYHVSLTRDATIPCPRCLEGLRILNPGVDDKRLIPYLPQIAAGTKCKCVTGYNTPSPGDISWGAISLLNPVCSVCGDDECGIRCEDPDLSGENKNFRTFESFTLDRICQAFSSPATYGRNNLRFSDQTCLLAPEGTHDFVPITDMPLVHKYVHRIYSGANSAYSNGGGCRCGQHASKWRCTQPLSEELYENKCKVLRAQALAREAEVGSTFDGTLHDLKTQITTLRIEDYWNYWRTKDFKYCTICCLRKKPSVFVELQCGHNDYCVDCFGQHIKARATEASIKCMVPECDYRIKQYELQKYMTRRAFKKRDERVTANALPSLCEAGEKLTYCPEQCGWCCIGDICPGVPRPTPCGKCDKEFCHKCGAKWTTVRGGSTVSHSNIECDQYALVCKTARQAEEERLSLAKVAEITKPCPQCQKPIEKNNGCNHMTCAILHGGCGYQFCWTCLGGYRTAEWRAMPEEWKLDEKNYLFPCSSCSCFNVPGGTPDVEVVVEEGYSEYRNDEF